jgi:hypothetical protein
MGVGMAPVGVAAGGTSAHAVQTSSATMARVLLSRRVQLDIVAMVCCRVGTWQMGQVAPCE